ncbi:MAG: HAD family hydrolase [Bacteroidaceae bacterium]
MNKKKLLIFDLDGTLINSIEDLANSTNFALQQCNYPTHPTNRYPLMVGNGINKLFERALPEGEKTAANIVRMRQAFLAHYSNHNTEKSYPYEGITNLLTTLHQSGYKLAVASNKYQAGTQKIVQHFFPQIPWAEIYGQQEGVPTKPDPTIVFKIMQQTQVKKEEILYVGDSGVDMQTAYRAKVDSVGVTWGFRTKEELVENKAGFMVDRPKEILDLL